MDTPPQPGAPAPITYWRPPESEPVFGSLPQSLRERLGGLVGAMTVQALLASAHLLPTVPGGLGGDFWGTFAAIELSIAVLLSFLLGPRVRLGAIGPMGRLVLGVAFGVVPLAAFVLVIGRALADAFRRSAEVGASTTVVAVFLAAAFFGLPVLVLATGPRPAPEGAPA